jgi:hypothetical protein
LTASRLSLGEIQARRTSIEWYDAVAVAQGLCLSMIESDDLVGPDHLDLSSVSIDADGGVAAEASEPGTTIGTIRQIGALLALLLPAHDFMFLRERVVAKAIASAPVYRSLQDLSQALAYYERPNRVELIRALYQRAEDGRAVVGAPAPVPLAQVAAPVVQPPSTPKVRRRGLAHLMGITVATVIVTVVIVGGIGAWKLGAWSFLGNKVFVQGGAPAVARVVPEASESSAPPVVNPERKSARPLRTKPAPEPAASIEPVPALPVLAEPERTVSAPPVVNDLPVVREPDVPSAEPAPPPVVDRPAIHRATEGDVTPPQMVYPQTLQPAVAGMSRQDFLRIEVVVNDHGVVESAKAKDVPRNLTESMMLFNALATAKSWRFNPAVKHDEPVRYAQLIALPLH